MSFCLIFIIDATGKLFVADLGISRQMQEKTAIVTTAMGTLCWMASEVSKGETKSRMTSDIQVMERKYTLTALSLCVLDLDNA